MVERSHDDVMADQALVPDADAALVLELAPGIDEDALAQFDIASKVRVERREQHHRIVNMPAGQLPEELVHFMWTAVATIQFRADAQRVLARAMHESMQLRTGGNSLAGIQHFQKIINVHDSPISDSCH
ncbi:hypothetical protein [Glutamicibacter nicotianae]|uniref:hypothetical protein n=1 Tax=Glutamicibacter nicotianae TaxID=37929 RepID=UPI003B39FD73